MKAENLKALRRTVKKMCHLCCSIFLAANVLQLTEYKPGNLSMPVWTVMSSIFKARNLTCVYPLHKKQKKERKKINKKNSEIYEKRYRVAYEKKRETFK